MTNLTASLTVTKKIGNFLSSLLLGETKELIIKTAVKVEEIEKDVIEIKQDIREIKIKLERHDKDIQGLKVHTRYGFANSPVKPNKLGRLLLDKSGFSDQYPKIKKRLFPLMNKMRLRTLYDYEYGGFEALNKIRNDPLIDPLKDYAVNHPDEPLELIFKVASWVIRDDYKEMRDRKS